MRGEPAQAAFDQSLHASGLPADQIAQLREAFPDLPEDPDQKTVFLKLRELRNKW